ncbi:MAG: hypothetical protein KA004_01185 [Verrucomicrobiales bacterium]|nr:hypothetical protein [Verrucomicrobiales bacterium]
MTSSWQFNHSPWVIAIAAVFLAASVWFFIRCLKREGASRRMVLLHLLRLLVAGLVAFTLLRPERVAVMKRTQQPRILILHDGSGSMATRDVMLENQPPAAREEWLKKQIDAQFWKPLEARYQVSVEPFSVPPPPDARADVETEVGTDIFTPLDQAARQYDDLRAVVLLTDGDANLAPPAKTPATAASALQQKGVPIFAVGVGSENYLPDVDLQSVLAPTYGLLNERISVMATVQNRLNREVKTTLTVAGPGGATGQKQIVLPPMGQVQEMVVVTPQQEGEGEFKLSLPVEKEEVFPANNERTFRMAIRKETLKVLVLDSQPRWEFRYLRNALMRDPGVAVNCVLYHPQLGMGQGNGYLNAFPEKKEDLQGYDVIFLGDVGVGAQLSQQDAERIRGLVEQQASGLVFLPGSLGRHKTLAESPLQEMLPVEVDYSKAVGNSSAVESKLELTFRGRDHWLTMLSTDPAANQAVWKGLPGFYWYAPVVRARAGSEVLAVHEVARNQNGRIPLLVTRNFGNGKVLYMGTDAAWRWRKGVEDTYHYRFWGQVVRWMAHQRHLAQEEGLRFFFNPEAPKRGEKVRLSATVMDKLGIPISTGKVSVTLKAPGGVAETVDLAMENAEWGVHAGQFIPREGGTYEVEVNAPDAGRKLKTKIDVTVPTLEKVGQPAKLDVLREIAAISSGKFGGPGDLAALISQISVLPEPRQEEQRFRLWCHPWWCGAILGLLVVYWVGRKLAGLQ